MHVWFKGLNVRNNKTHILILIASLAFVYCLISDSFIWHTHFSFAANLCIFTVIFFLDFLHSKQIRTLWNILVQGYWLYLGRKHFINDILGFQFSRDIFKCQRVCLLSFQSLYDLKRIWWWLWRPSKVIDIYVVINSYILRISIRSKPLFKSEWGKIFTLIFRQRYVY